MAGAHVRHELLNQACKRKKVSARQAGLSANSERTFFDAPLAEESAAELDQWSRFHQEVEKLPAREREVLSLIFYHGWTQRQIAKLLCITVRTVRRYRRTATRKIQKALEHSTRLERDRPKP